MNRFLLLPAFLGFLFFASTGCKRDNDVNAALRGKLVLASGCGNYVIQLLQGQLPANKINASWKDPLTDSVYTNVFTALNDCDFQSLATGDVISFRVTDSATHAIPTCVVCVWFRPTPPAGNVVVDIRKLN